MMVPPRSPISSLAGGVASTPAVRRRRQACERCWKRKNKCDKLLPSCSLCSAAKIECRARVVDDAGLTNASLRNYVESLEQKLQEQETSAQPSPAEKRQCVQADRPRRFGVAGAPHEAPTEVSVQSASQNATPLEVATGDVDPSVRDTMGEIGFLSRSAMAEPRDEPGTLPQSLSLVNTLKAALALNASNPSRATVSSVPKYEIEFVLLTPTKLRREATLAHMTRFLEHVCISYPFLNAKLLMAQYEQVLATMDENNHGHIPPGTALEYFNVCLAVAIGAMKITGSGSSSSLISSLHLAAVKQLPEIYARDKFDFLHCILFLVIFSTMSPEGGSSWHLVELAMRTCITLGLHKEPDEHTHTDDVEKLRRKNLFWSTYILDRSISLSLGRPFGIHEEDITVHVPEVSEMVDDVNASLACHLVTHARLMSHIACATPSLAYNYGNYCFWRQWPASVKRVAETQHAVSDLLEQLACRTLVQLVGPSVFSTRPNEILGGACHIEADVSRACQHLIDQFYDRFQELHQVASFIDAYDLFAATVTFVLLARRSSSVLTSILETIHKCSILMTVAGERFPVFRSFQSCLLSISTRLLGGIRPHTSTGLPPESPEHIRSMVEKLLD